jgi:ribosomal protein S18 acetylase RimI-like enzyme
MSRLEIRPVDAGRWDDLQTVLNGGGDGHSCQCMWPVLPRREWRASSVDDRGGLLKAEVASAPPGLLAYAGSEPVGWVRVGPRPPLRRILASRTVSTGSAEPRDDPTVWAVSCFSVRREHRGGGVVAELLDGAIRHARSAGGRVLEAYPVDVAGASHPSNDLYVGVLSTFEAAGFAVVARPSAARAVVALTL